MFFNLVVNVDPYDCVQIFSGTGRVWKGREREYAIAAEGDSFNTETWDVSRAGCSRSSESRKLM
jgi:hypothetical protein